MGESPALRVTWVKNTNSGQYFDLLRLDLNSSYFSSNPYGMYLIWYVAPANSKAIKVGHGYLKSEFLNARQNPQVLQYSSKGQIKVAWFLGTSSTLIYFDQIEAYLDSRYVPVIRIKDYANISKVSINLLI